MSFSEPCGYMFVGDEPGQEHGTREEMKKGKRKRA